MMEKANYDSKIRACLLAKQHWLPKSRKVRVSSTGFWAVLGKTLGKSGRRALLYTKKVGMFIGPKANASV
jgi:hypothetical protein